VTAIELRFPGRRARGVAATQTELAPVRTPNPVFECPYVRGFHPYERLCSCSVQVASDFTFKINLNIEFNP
jgi:hypothetical protein